MVKLRDNGGSKVRRLVIVKRVEVTASSHGSMRGLGHCEPSGQRADGLVGVRDRAPRRLVVRQPLREKSSTPVFEIRGLK